MNARFTNVVGFLAAVALAALAGGAFGGVVAGQLSTRLVSAERTELVGSRLNDAVGIFSKRRALIIVTRSQCKYCTASMAFYRRLVRDVAENLVTLVFVTSETPIANADYLRSFGLGDHKPISIAEIGLEVRGTPSILLVEDNTVKREWLGMLRARDERQILEALRASE